MGFRNVEKLKNVPENGYVLLNVNGSLKQVPAGALAGTAYASKNKVSDYLYEMHYDKLDYEFAQRYFQSNHVEPVPGCSSIYNNGLYGRNLDWTYDNSVEFVVHTPNQYGRYATLGVSSCMKEATKKLVESGDYSHIYKIVPFRIVDGINEYGLTISTNVVPLDHAPTTHTTPTQDKLLTIPTFMVPRFVLDYFQNAEDAIDYMTKHVEIYVPKYYHKMGYEVHFMVADSENCYILEIVDNALVVVENVPYSTNFYLNDVTFDENGKVSTPETGNPVEDNGITEHGSGLERFNILAEASSETLDKEDMAELLSAIKYTNTYKDTTSPFWYSEYVGTYGDLDLKLSDDISKYEPVIDAAMNIFEHRSRNPESEYYGSWHTVHSSIYDISSKTLDLVVQEDGLTRNFSI